MKTAENKEVDAPEKNESEKQKKSSERTENIVALAVFALLILIGIAIFTKGFGLSGKSSAGATKMTMTIENDPYTGNINASITIVAFSDYECPFCKKAEQTIKDIMNKYNGKVLYVFKDYPLTVMHPYAYNASLAAECAKEQDKYWEFHDYLFEHQDQLEVQHLEEYASLLGLNTEKFNSCFETQRYKGMVDQDVRVGTDAGVSGTPTFIIFNGNARTIGTKSTEAFIIVGAQPEATFTKIIDADLKSK